MTPSAFWAAAILPNATRQKVTDLIWASRRMRQSASASFMRRPKATTSLKDSRPELPQAVPGKRWASGRQIDPPIYCEAAITDDKSRDRCCRGESSKAQAWRPRPRKSGSYKNGPNLGASEPFYAILSEQLRWMQPRLWLKGSSWNLRPNWNRARALVHPSHFCHSQSSFFSRLAGPKMTLIRNLSSSSLGFNQVVLASTQASLAQLSTGSTLEA